MCVCVYIYIYICLTRTGCGLTRAPRSTSRLDLYTILPSPMVYGVWHTKGGGRWGSVYCAMVVQ